MAVGHKLHVRHNACAVVVVPPRLRDAVFGLAVLLYCFFEVNSFDEGKFGGIVLAHFVSLQNKHWVIDSLVFSL